MDRRDGSKRKQFDNNEPEFLFEDSNPSPWREADVIEFWGNFFGTSKRSDFSFSLKSFAGNENRKVGFLTKGGSLVEGEASMSQQKIFFGFETRN